MKYLKIFFIILLFSTLSACVGIYEDGKEIASVVSNNIEEVTVDSLIVKIENGDEFYLLDVRQENEYKKGNIEGSFNIPRGELEFFISDSLGYWEEQLFYAPLKDDQIIIYCKSGARGTLAAHSLKQLGFTNVKNLIGGKEAWDEKLAEATNETEKSKFEILKEYLTENNMDLNNMLQDWIIPVAKVNGNEADFYIMDIRKTEDFETGHIAGAINSSLENIVIDASEVDKKILVVCYTGQTAAHAVIALRLSGHSDAQVLKFGIAAWNTKLAEKWNSNIGDAAIDNPNWVTTETATLQTFENPTITSDYTTGEEILAQQIELLTSFSPIINTDVLETPTDYFINNFWAEEDVTHYGHIDGAYRIKPLTIAGDEYLYLDPSKTIVTYCWTGQTSSLITAYLRVLGYNAVSLKFGANGMVHSKLESHKWETEIAGEFNFITGTE